MKKLPLLLSIPHSGPEAPAELRDRIIIDKYDLHDDIDPFTRQIYDLGEKVEAVVTTNIARTFVDVNRAPDDRPPQNPDGVVKSKTCLGRPIYLAGQEIDEQLTAELLRRYYHPYHDQIEKALQRPEIELALDCHSMLAVGPAISPDTGQKRPKICLGNRHGKTCTMELMARLSACFQEAFSLGADEVTINKPFAGGYITRKYGAGPIPWIQVEINRAIYLTSPWFERHSLKIDEKRLLELNERFEKALTLFF